MSIEPLLLASRTTLLAAVDIFLASVADYTGFDPERNYSPKEREPLDALSDHIAHEYLPEELARAYAAIVGRGGAEFMRLHGKAEGLE